MPDGLDLLGIFAGVNDHLFKVFSDFALIYAKVAKSLSDKI